MKSYGIKTCEFRRIWLFVTSVAYQVLLKMAVLYITLICYMIVCCSGLLSIPMSLLSPLGMPSAMGPSGLLAVKLAVGTQLLNMLGLSSPGSGAVGSGFPSPIAPLDGLRFIGQDFPPYQAFPDDYRAIPSTFPMGLTPKSKEFSGFSKRRGPSIPTTFDINTATPTEIENFFGILNRVDANKCISRLVCEIGADPKVLEGLGHNVKDVISSLRVLERNKMSQKYKDIMLSGQKSGIASCPKSFSTCDARSYRLIRTYIRAFRVRSPTA